MITGKNISYIINSTLKRCGLSHPAMEMVIKGTFLMESNLEDLFDLNTNSYGLMMMTESEIDKVYDHLTFNARHALRFNKATFAEFKKLDREEFKELVRSSISAMVFVLYTFYKIEHIEFPPSELKEVARYYVRVFVKDNDPDIVSDFMELYKSVFK